MTVGVVDASGQPASGSATLVVHADPAVTGIAPSSDPSTVGQSLTLVANVSGGSGAYTYTWTGLPTGCATVNAATLTCTPTATGTFTVNLVVKDSLGVSATGQGPVTISARPSTSVLGLPPLVAYGAIAAVLIVVVAAVALLMMRRRGPPKAAEPAEPETASGETWSEDQAPGR